MENDEQFIKEKFQEYKLIVLDTKRLSNVETNRVYRVKCFDPNEEKEENDTYICKLYNVKDGKEIETDIGKQCQEHGIGPVVLYSFDEGRIEKDLMLESYEMSEQNISKIVELIFKYHSLRIKNPPMLTSMYFWEKWMFYFHHSHLFTDDEKNAARKKYKQLISYTRMFPLDNIVLCHNDLWSGNIVFSSIDKNFKLIDFEMTQYGYVYYDLANFFFYDMFKNDTDDELKKFALEMYNLVSDKNIKFEQILRVKPIVYFSWCLWALYMLNQTGLEKYKNDAKKFYTMFINHVE